MVSSITDILFVNKGILEINHPSKTKHVLYCIGDFAGNVLMRGNFRDLENNKLSVRSLAPGTYTFCIIDGDQLVKIRFIID